jgi:transcriptional regulator with XRE-family HTH domain
MTRAPLSLTLEQVRAMVIEQTNSRGALTAFARRCGVGRPYICQVRNGDTPPSDKVLAALGLRKQTVTRYIADATPVFSTTRKGKT